MSFISWCNIGIITVLEGLQCCNIFCLIWISLITSNVWSISNSTKKIAFDDVRKNRSDKNWFDFERLAKNLNTVLCKSFSLKFIHISCVDCTPRKLSNAKNTLLLRIIMTQYFSHDNFGQFSKISLTIGLYQSQLYRPETSARWTQTYTKLLVWITTKHSMLLRDCHE